MESTLIKARPWQRGRILSIIPLLFSAIPACPAHILYKSLSHGVRMTHRILNKQLLLFDIGGLLYVLIELAWRGTSHWTMFLLGGLCFVCLGLINEVIPWETPLWQQVLAGLGIIAVLEFLTGCIVNLWLGWDIWDYSDKWGNILGQICPEYILLWIPVALAAILLDDCLRRLWFREDQPHYNIGLSVRRKKIIWLNI